MASIRKNGPRFEARVTVERKTTSRSFDTYAQARKWAASIESGLAASPAPQPPATPIAAPLIETPTLDQACLRYSKEVSVKHKGAAQELQHLKEIRRQPIASKAMAAITSADIKQLRDAELARGLAGDTVRKKLSLISVIYRHAANDWGMDIDNPVARVRRPAAGTGRTRRLNKDEIARLQRGMTACNRTMRALVLLAIETGMRRSEMLSMTWSAVNFERGVIALADTKNGHPRWIPLTPTAREILLSQQDGSQPFPITAVAAALSWKRIIKRAQIEDLRFHDLRHEALSRWAHRLGGDVFKLSLVSGHRTLSMAQRYVHPVISELIAASQINQP